VAGNESRRAAFRLREADHGRNPQLPQHVTTPLPAPPATLVSGQPRRPGANPSHILESDEDIESSPSRHGHAVAQSHLRRR
jgi:hypothetical protein